MITLLTILLFTSGTIFIIAVMLLAPKWWIGFGIGGAAWSNEYWSKKSIEGTLKNIAFISIAIFLTIVIIYPYMNKNNSNNTEKTTTVLDNVQTEWAWEWLIIESIGSWDSQ